MILMFNQDVIGVLWFGLVNIYPAIQILTIVQIQRKNVGSPRLMSLMLARG